MRSRQIWIYLVIGCLQLEVCEWNQGEALQKLFARKQKQDCVYLTYLDEPIPSIGELEAQEKRAAFQLSGRWKVLEKQYLLYQNKFPGRLRAPDTVGM